jgi:putative heme-binding domain-containing protein
VELGDSQSPDAIAGLVRAALEQPKDRWLRAVILSGIRGREEVFLRELIRSRDRWAPETADLLPTVGRGIRDWESLRAFLHDENLSGPSPVLFALVDGFVEAHGSAEMLNDQTGPGATILKRAKAAVSDESSTPETRVAAIRLLAHFPNDAAVVPVLLDAVKKGQNDTVQAAAIRSLAGLNSAEVPRGLLTPERWRSYSPSERDAVLNALLGNANHFAGILDAVESGAVSSNSIAAQRRALLLKSKDAAIRSRAEKLLQSSTPDRDAALARAKTALALKPNAPHGHEVFKNLCATCHRFEREGYAVGPDLFDIRNQPKENILFHIVVPDAEIAPAFAPYLVETRDGRTWAGLLASETPTSVKVRMPLGQEEVILRSDVAKIEAMPNSLMPSGLDAAMSPQDLADLLAYLRGEK